MRHTACSRRLADGRLAVFTTQGSQLTHREHVDIVRAMCECDADPRLGRQRRRSSGVSSKATRMRIRQVATQLRSSRDRACAAPMPAQAGHSAADASGSRCDALRAALPQHLRGRQDPQAAAKCAGDIRQAQHLYAQQGCLNTCSSGTDALKCQRLSWSRCVALRHPVNLSTKRLISRTIVVDFCQSNAAPEPLSIAQAVVTLSEPAPRTRGSPVHDCLLVVLPPMSVAMAPAWGQSHTPDLAARARATSHPASGPQAQCPAR